MYLSLKDQAGKLNEEFREIATFACCLSLNVLFIKVNLRKRMKDYSGRVKLTSVSLNFSSLRKHGARDL